MVEEFKAQWAPGVDEDEEVRLMDSRAELVARIEDMKADNLENGKAGV